MRKIFATALVLVLAVSLLTACGGNNNGNPTGETNAPASTNGGSPNQGDASFTPDKISYAPGDTIRITVMGMTQEMLDNRAWISLSKPGEPQDAFEGCIILEETGTFTVEMTASGDDGNYELRMFRDNSGDASALIYMVPIAIASAEQQHENNGGDTGGDTGAVSGTVEEIKALMAQAGYSGSKVSEIRGDLLFGASAGLNYMDANDKGLLQIYFYPSASAAAAGKSVVWDPTAEGLELLCKISGSFVYTGSEDFVLFFEGLL